MMIPGRPSWMYIFFSINTFGSIDSSSCALYVIKCECLSKLKPRTIIVVLVKVTLRDVLQKWDSISYIFSVSFSSIESLV